MNFKYSFLLVILYSFASFSQLITIKVIDDETQAPLKNVSVYKQSNLLTTTDTDGQASLPAIGDTATMSFRHTAYEDINITMDQLKGMNYTVKLSKSIVTLSTMTVTASKWEENRSEVPNKVTTLTKGDAAFSNAQTSADLLGSSGEVFIQKSQLGGGSPMLRGFTANSVLLVVDGVRMNNAIYRAGNLQNVISIDANAIENVEVIFGPGSIIYGSDALGGVFSFHTKNPLPADDEKVAFSGDFMGRFSSADMEKTGHIGLNLGFKKFGSYTAVTFSDFDDLRMGQGGEYYDFYKRPEYVDRINGRDTIVENEDPAVQKSSGYSQWNVLEKLVLNVSDNLKLQNAFYFSTTSDFPRYDRLIQYKDDLVTLKNAEWYYGPQRWIMDAFTLSFKRRSLLFDVMTATIAYQNYEESRNERAYRKNLLISRTEDVNGISGNFDFNKGFGAKSSLLYGLEAVYNSVKSTAEQKDIVLDTTGSAQTRYPDDFNDYVTGAVYGYFKTNWHRVFTSVLGVRYSHVYLKSGIDENQRLFPYLPSNIKINAGSFNFSVGGVVRPLENWNINLNASSGYRAPNVDDVGKIFDVAPGTVRMPNDELKPEYAYNLDFSTNARFLKIIGFEAAVFATYVKDLMNVGDFTYNGQEYIVYNGDTCKVVAVVNKAKAYIWGGSGAISFDFTRFLSLKNTLTYVRGIEGNDTVPLRPVPPLYGASHLLFDLDRVRTDFYVCYNAEKIQGTHSGNMVINDENRAYLYPKNDDGLYICPAWYTLNLKASVDITKNFTLDAGAENILNRCYRSYGSGISAPGLNVITAIRARF